MRGRKYPTCIFCQKSDSEPSKEDVLAKWIARELAAAQGNKPEYLARTGRLGDQDWPSREYAAIGKLGWETHGPCKRCNNGWMSKLENAAKPVLLPMMLGHDCSVGPTELLILAQWTVKTALMYEYMKYQSNRFFTRRDRVALFQRLAIPENTYIYAARYIGAPVHSIGGPMKLHFPGTSAEGRGYCATTAIGQLALQILCLRPPEHFDRPLQFRVPARWDGVHKPVWPAGGGWNWPPAVALDNDGFRAFATRVPVQIT